MLFILSGNLCQLHASTKFQRHFNKVVFTLFTREVKMSKTFIAISTLIGTIIGAGILGIPYVVMKSGFFLGLISILLIAVVMIITMLYLGEVTLRTNSNHHLAGYAEKYLGKKGKLLMFISLIVGVYGAILAYLIGEGESLSYLFFENINHTLYFGLGFWVLMSIICYFGLKALEEGEELGVILIAVLIVLISVIFWNKIEVNNLNYVNWKNMFVPFGVVLFAFLGFNVIPEVKRIFGDDKRGMKRAIIIANLIVLVVYILFAYIVLGSQGENTPELATLVLGKIFIILGMITMLTSYLGLSISLIDTLKFDFGISKVRSWIYTIIPPIFLFTFLEIFNLTSFTKVIGVGGVMSGGLTGILILFMIKEAKKKGDRVPEYSIPYSSILAGIIIAIFVIGALLEILNTLK